MNKTAIKNYAVWARVQLIEAAKQKAFEYEITDGGENKPNIDSIGGRMLSGAEREQRNHLISEINQKGFTQVMEEVAYTWFNRFIALRYMEVNGYLPSKVRVFTDENGAFKPEILKEAMNVELDGLDRDKILELLDRQDNEALYKYLLITQCNALGEGLPYMFEKISNWTELLFPANLLRSDSVIGQMISGIPEDNWTDAVQIIGWLYQYYNAELKDDTFAKLKKNIKISKERIPAATQLFTPDWIVRYMVENSLGRLYIDKRKTEGVFADGRGLDEMTWQEAENERIETEKEIAKQMGWKYYLPEAEQEPEVRAQLNIISKAQTADFDVTKIKVIDPCMGSGHILVYAFDVLMQIYTSEGWSEREAAKSIIENNLYGLDIDDRAGQLAYFAVMMKARKYNRRILSENIRPSVMAIRESNNFNPDYLSLFEKLKDKALMLLNNMKDAKELGSIIQVSLSLEELSALKEKAGEIKNKIYDNFFDSAKKSGIVTDFMPLIEQAIILARKYDVVVTNPPYMGASGMNAKLGDFVKKNYPDSKNDLFAVFIERGNTMVQGNGYNSMVTMQSWMFLSSFEKMRINLIKSRTITNLMHMENMVMGIAFGTAVTIFKNEHIGGYKGTYNQIKLCDISNGVPTIFPNYDNRFSQTSTDNFPKIPGSPVAYWVSEAFRSCFNEKTISYYGQTRNGMTTGSNDTFMRAWYEVNSNNSYYSAGNADESINTCAKWFPYNKGGECRRWYGNMDYVINWGNNGQELKNYSKSILRNQSYYFKECITWSLTNSSKFGVRFRPQGSLFDVNGMSLFPKEKTFYLIGVLNSKISSHTMRIINPTISNQAGDIDKIPVKYSSEMDESVISLVKSNINLSKTDWDSFESSWDFKRHPLV